MKKPTSKPFVPYPETWDEVAIVEDDEPQLDLFETPCIQTVDDAQSQQRVP